MFTKYILKKGSITFCEPINAHFYVGTAYIEPAQLFIKIIARVNTVWVQIKKLK